MSENPSGPTPGLESGKRFVIQEHCLRDDRHWDLMLEQEDVLLTWQLLRHPESVFEAPIAARRIGDHRKAYLTYEGPVSGNRGRVRIFDRGTYVSRGRDDGHMRIELQGQLIAGKFDLIGTADAPDSWSLAFVPRDPPPTPP